MDPRDRLRARLVGFHGGLRSRIDGGGQVDADGSGASL
jgi:hypothetical protein